jgi:single-strand DNA-binding protein
MFDTYVTVVGNVLTAPQWRRTANTNSLVAKFKVASTARRLDRENGRWVDGNSLRVRVNCWRKLAEGVASSVMVGDPIVVVGRLYTRDWTDGDGNHRTLYEMEAVAVGHDLARGRARFARNKPALATSSVEDADAESRIRGEVTEPVPADQAPARPGDLFDDPDPAFNGALPPATSPDDELAMLRGGGFDADPLAEPTEDDLGPAGFSDETDPPDEPSEGANGLDALGDGGARVADPAFGGSPDQPADDPGEAIGQDPAHDGGAEAGGDHGRSAARPRRARGRQSVSV